MGEGRLRVVGAAYVACALVLAVTAVAALLLGQTMLDSMVQLMSAILLP